MYENHFNLKERPFRNVPDTRMFFDGGGRGDILKQLLFAIESGEGIVKVVGEVGSGKTMICRMLNESLTGRVQVVFLSNPSLEPDYILHAVAQELGLPIEISTNRFKVQQILQKYLLEQHENDHQVVVLIEEAQSMPPRTLEEIRLMSNLETEQKKLLQLVLFGQPELDTLLNRADLRQFNERISYALNLKPFTLAEHREYLNHRLSVAGYQGSELFNTLVVKHIHQFAKGSVRRINLLADKTLLAAYAYNDNIVTIKHARSAAEDSKYIERVNSYFSLKIIVPASVVAISLFMFIFNSNFLVGQKIVNKKVNESLLSQINQEQGDRKLENSNSEIIIKENSEVFLKVSSNQIRSRPVFVKTKISDNESLLASSRVEQTTEWLKFADKSQYTIQLMTAFVNEPSELYELEDILQNRIKNSEIENFYVFRGKAKGNSVFVICYKIFSGLSSARNALMDLPSGFKRYKPFVRNVSSIILEIEDEDV